MFSGPSGSMALAKEVLFGMKGLGILLMDKILHDPKLWELWYIPYNG